MKKIKFWMAGLLMVSLCINAAGTEMEAMTVKAKAQTLQESVGFQVERIDVSVKGDTAENENVLMDEQGLCYAPVLDEDGYEFHDDTLWVYAGEDVRKKLVIPDTFQGKKVVQVAPEGFMDCTELKSVTFGKNIRVIRNSAFYDCNNLSEVKFQDNTLTNIWSYAFSGCSSLKAIELPKGLEGISSYAFSYSGLEEITIPDTVDYIFNKAFLECKKLKKVTLGKKIGMIYKNCFKECTSLEEVIIPKGIKTIEEKAFNNCKKLRKVVFQGDTYNIDINAFKGTQFEKDRRNKGKYYIVNGVLLDVYSNVAGDLTIDGKQTFYGQKIKCVAGKSFTNNKKLGKLVLKNLKGVGGEAFAHCKAEAIEIRNVGVLGITSFRYLETETIYIKKVEKLEHQCFYGTKAKKLSMYIIGAWDALYIPDNAEKFTLNGLEKKHSIPDFGKKMKVAEMEGNFDTIFYGYGEFSTSLEKLTIETPCVLEWYKVGRPKEDVWFQGCENLKDIYLKTGGVSPTVKDVFPRNITLHVPKSQVREYRKYVDCKVVAW